MSDFPEPPPATDVPIDRTFAILAHIGGIFFSLFPALVIYLITKPQPGSEFHVDHAKEALNFQITLLIGYAVCSLLFLVVIGVFLLWILMIANLVLCIVAAVKASNGERYRYPLTLRLIK